MWGMKLLLIIVIYTHTVNSVESSTSTTKDGVKDDSTSPTPAVTTDPDTSPATVPSTNQATSAKPIVQTETTQTIGSPTMTTVAPTTATTASTEATTAGTTTTAPTPVPVVPTAEIDSNCSHLLLNSSDADSWCNTSIAGEAECSNSSQQCVCSSGYFQLSSTVCSPASDLEPYNLTVSDRTSSSFNISWDVHTSVSSLNLTYTVKAFLGDGGNQEFTCTPQLGTSTAHCSGLVPGHWYNTTVSVAYMSYTKEKTVSMPIYPGQPGMINISASDLEAPNITLVWGAAPGRVDNYSVVVKDLVTGAKSTLNNSVHLEGVKVSTQYSIKIVSVSYGLESCNDTTFKTNSAEPDPPVDLNVTITNETSIRLTWTRPNVTNGDLRFYQVCRESRAYPDQQYTQDICVNVSGADTEHTDTGLAAGTQFRYVVRTVNDMYMSQNATTDPFETQEDVPGVVDGMKVVPNDTSFRVTWQRPTSPHGDIIAYQITWVQQADPSNNCSAMLKTNMWNVTANTSGEMCKDMEDKNISLNQASMEYLIHDLKPHSLYNISVAAYTSQGRGVEQMEIGETSISVPDPVTNVVSENITSTSVYVQWTMPTKDPGPVNYTVQVTDLIRPGIAGPSGCSVEGSKETGCLVTGLEEFWQYRFAVNGTTIVGSTVSDDTLDITTKEDHPGKLTVSNIQLYNTTSECDATRVKLTWIEPSLLERNSRIVKYTIINGSIPMHLIVQNITVKNPEPYAESNRPFSDDITQHVMAERPHVWKMFAVSESGLEGVPADVTFKTGSCPPPAWDRNVNSFTKSHVTTGTITLHVTTQFFTSVTQGAVEERGLLICSERVHLEVMHGDDIVITRYWSDSSKNGFQSPYKIKPFRNMDSASVTLVIGENGGCGPNRITTECNGPLPEGTHMYVRGYSCTAGYKCTISPVYGPYLTGRREPEKKANNSWAIPVALLIMIAVMLGAFFGLWRKGIIEPTTWVDKCNKPEPDPTPLPPEIVKNRPFKVSNYDAVLAALHKDTNLMLSDQYEDVQKIGSRIVEESTMEASNLEPNKAKNRWVNILPFDHSRVKLRQIDEDDPTSDYINANYMPGFNNRREYIATQGPLPGTIDDFWRMTWEHNVAVVVMLTQCKEGNRVKCEMYWPDEVNEPKQYGDVVVNPQSISHLDKYNISKFQLSVNQQTRQVIHLHYLDFPDFSANVEFDNFIDFVKVVRSHVPHDMEGPMIVHCSAGVGRTGTFMAIDRLIQTLNSPAFSFDQTIDIFDMVISMRSNRVLMVQTESQFVMIHDCLQQLLEAKKAAMAAANANSTEHLYENQAFDPSPEVFYENVDPREMKTEL